MKNNYKQDRWRGEGREAKEEKDKSVWGGGGVVKGKRKSGVECGKYVTRVGGREQKKKKKKKKGRRFKTLAF